MAIQQARSEGSSNCPWKLEEEAKTTPSSTKYLVPTLQHKWTFNRQLHVGLQWPLNSPSCCGDDHTHRSSQTANNITRGEGKRCFGNNTLYLILQYQMPSKTLQSISTSVAPKFLNPKIIWEDKPSPPHPLHTGKAQTCQLGLINIYITPDTLSLEPIPSETLIIFLPKLMKSVTSALNKMKPIWCQLQFTL